MRTSITLFLSPLPASDLIPVSPSEFSFELPLGNIRTFFKCHLFWSQGVSQLQQGDGVMDAWNNVKMKSFDLSTILPSFIVILSLAKSTASNRSASAGLHLYPPCRTEPRSSSSPLKIHTYHCWDFFFRWSGGSTLVSAGGRRYLKWKTETNSFGFKRQFFAA